MAFTVTSSLNPCSSATWNISSLQTEVSTFMGTSSFLQPLDPRQKLRVFSQEAVWLLRRWAVKVCQLLYALIKQEEEEDETEWESVEKSALVTVGEAERGSWRRADKSRRILCGFHTNCQPHAL